VGRRRGGASLARHGRNSFDEDELATGRNSERGVLTSPAFIHDIPCSPDNPEFRWVYDTEIVRDLIAPFAPVCWYILPQQDQHRDAERHNGQRSLVGTTMGRNKTLIGPRLRARGFAAQQTEAALGRPESFRRQRNIA
jgi:hypothetical protein